jgi:hypothetical protein
VGLGRGNEKAQGLIPIDELVLLQGVARARVESWFDSTLAVALAGAAGSREWHAAIASDRIVAVCQLIERKGREGWGLLAFVPRYRAVLAVKVCGACALRPAAVVELGVEERSVVSSIEPDAAH